MSISLNENGAYAPSGGTAIGFTATGTTVTGGREYINTAETDFFARESLTITYRAPSVQTDGSFSKGKYTAKVQRPRRDATTGVVTYNLIRIELEVDPIAGTTEGDNLRSLASSVLSDAELTDFWRTGGTPA